MRRASGTESKPLLGDLSQRSGSLEDKRSDVYAGALKQALRLYKQAVNSQKST